MTRVIQVKAEDVRIGDRIASRNSCGGLANWNTVLAPLGTGPGAVAIPTEGGGFYSCRAGEMVEIAERPRTNRAGFTFDEVQTGLRRLERAREAYESERKSRLEHVKFANGLRTNRDNVLDGLDDGPIGREFTAATAEFRKLMGDELCLPPPFHEAPPTPANARTVSRSCASRSGRRSGSGRLSSTRSTGSRTSRGTL